MTLDNAIRDLVQAEVRRIVKPEALVEGASSIPEADAELREQAQRAAARIRRARGGAR